MLMCRRRTYHNSHLHPHLGIVTEKKIYIFSGVTGKLESDAHILIGEIDLKSAFSLDVYQIEWWTSLNFTDGLYFIAGDESRLQVTKNNPKPVSE